MDYILIGEIVKDENRVERELLEEVMKSGLEEEKETVSMCENI